jgi:hypothetical protein
MSYIGNAQSFRVEGNVPGNLTVSGNTTISGSSATVNGDEVRTLGTSGAIVQVVQNTYATQVRSQTNTLVDTGLNATITPTSSSNKILVFVQQSGCYKDSNNTHGTIRLYRGTTFIQMIDNYFAYTNSTARSGIGSVCGQFLDSPATTSAITYKTQFSSVANSAWVYVQVQSETSTMTLMEIVA